ncbi:MAG TPA: hypothetical protein VHE61_14230 [Opitutaceae bacterium]|nr:hypothetical protein [Opitutaceae bacterium]
MNSHHACLRHQPVRAPSPRRLMRVAFLAGLSSFGFGAHAAPPAGTNSSAATSSAAKPYTLYLGTDISVEWKGKLRPVKSVDGGSFVVEVDGHRETVPTQFVDLKIKLDDALKVAPSGITVSDFKPEQAYTQDQDPNRFYDEAASAGGAGIDAIDAAAAAQRSAQMQGGNTMAAARATPQDASLAAAAVQSSQAMSAANQSLNNALNSYGAGSSFDTMADAASRAAAEADRKLFNAFRLSFEVSSPKPIAKPYMVLVIRRLDDRNDPKSMRQWVYAQELKPIGPGRHTVRLFRAGFPPGYKLVDVQLHLYEGGTELATNIARRNIGITADEAFQFSVVNYVERHKGATTDAVNSKLPIPAHLRSQLSADELSPTYYVKVAKSGLPVGAYLDESCTKPISAPGVSAALMAVRFYPALKDGKPQEAVAPVRL